MTQLHFSDNIEFMRKCATNEFDLAIVDPQTGQNEGRKHVTRPTAVKQKNGGVLHTARKHEVKYWDEVPPTQEYWDQLFRVSRHQIIMCENYLHFDQKKNSAGRIVWNLLRENDFSACQVMWTSLIQKIDYFEYLWSGMIQGVAINSRKQIGDKSKNEKRIHPSQKPVIVYRHLLREYAQKEWVIFDSHVGSASLAIACLEENFDFVGTENDKEIWEQGTIRVQEWKGRPKFAF